MFRPLLLVAGSVFGVAQVLDHRSFFYTNLMSGLKLVDPERAHNLAITALELGVFPRDFRADPAVLTQNLFGLTYRNPIGIAAGFDKDCRVPDALLEMGFGFVEVGSITPKPQPGNEKPRMFRLVEDDAVINRYGFNSEGLTASHQRLQDVLKKKAYNPEERSIIGVNLGKNKSSVENQVGEEDYAYGCSKFSPLAAYLVVNISSPNTPGLRSLQGKEKLREILVGVLKTRQQSQHYYSSTPPPLFVKIAPDLSQQDKVDIADVILEMKIDGLIVSNTTVARPPTLTNENKVETGGLSGAPLMNPSTQLLREMYVLTNGKIPIIGVGGVFTGEDAYRKIRNGASLVQLYSSMSLKGPRVVVDVKDELAYLLERDGFKSVADAVGADVKHLLK